VYWFACFNAKLIRFIQSICLLAATRYCKSNKILYYYLKKKLHIDLLLSPWLVITTHVDPTNAKWRLAYRLDLSWLIGQSGRAVGYQSGAARWTASDRLLSPACFDLT